MIKNIMALYNGNVIMIPLIKDIQGSIYSVDNYRGITPSSLFAKLVEHCNLYKYDYLMISNCQQFGFKEFFLFTCSFCFKTKN